MLCSIRCDIFEVVFFMFRVAPVPRSVDLNFFLRYATKASLWAER